MIAAGTSQPTFEHVVDAVRAVAAGLNDERDLDDLLHLIADRMCELLDVRRCSIHLREENSDLYRGQVGHADHDIDPDVKRLIAGLPADRFTAEIVETQRPVLLTNARMDPRAIRSAMSDWNVRSVLGVPLVLKSEVIGIIFLDNEQEPHHFSTGEQQLAATFAELAASAIVQAQLTRELRASLATVAHQNDLIKRASHLEERLTRELLQGSSVGEIAATVAVLTNKPCVIYDGEFRLLAEKHPHGDRTPLPRLLDDELRATPAIAEALAGVAADTVLGPTIIGPLPSCGLMHRLLIAAVRVQGALWGWLVVVERGGRLDTVDALFLRRAASSIALQLGATRRAAGSDWDVGESLANGLIRGDSDAVSLQQSADMLGMRLDEPRVVCLIRSRTVGPTDRPPSARAVIDSLTGRTGQRAMAASVAGGVVVLIQVSAAGTKSEQLASISAVTADVLDGLAPDGGLLAAISPICADVANFRSAFEDAEDVMRCLEGYVAGPGNHVLTADALGAGRLFLSAAGGDRGRRFARDTLGPLLTPENAKMGELLQTLAVFLASSRHVRTTADHLDVHKNTVRYRLHRIHELTGLDVLEDAEAQLAAHMSLLILRLEGSLELGGALREDDLWPRP